LQKARGSTVGVPVLHINDLTYRIEGRVLFDQATAAISDGWKVGFVGRNGSGKSTLLRLIRGEIHPDEGDVSVRKNRRVGGVEQEAPASSASLIETVLACDEELGALLAEAETADDPHRIAEIHTRLADIGAHSAEARAAEILAGLGFSNDDQARACAAFSGGWRMRVALAGVLFSAPDLLLLDEPTNYLDLEGAMWLDAFLRSYPYTALIVSHDRNFLNRATSHILALEAGKLSVSAGGYDAYERKRAEARANALAYRAKQEAQRRHMQAFIDRFRAKASKAKQAQSRIKALERMQIVAAPIEERTIPFHFKNPRPMAPPIVRLVEADLGYAEDAPVLKKINLRIDQDDRIAILGPNGEGKSTLVKAISGRLAPLAGNVYRHKKLDVAYFAQHQLDELKPKQSPYDHVRALMPDGTEAQVRAATGGLGFSADKADVEVEKLSGGEKARLLLGLITFNGPHMIVLDEPTNHLDMDSREALAEALNDYAGAVLLITHDAHLAEAVADRLWLVRDKKVAPFEGDIEDYRRLVLEAGKTAPALRGKNSKGPQDQRANARQQSAAARDAINPLKKAAAAHEARLAELNAILARLDAALGEPRLYETDLARATKLQKERAALVSAIEAAEEAWLGALEAYESARTTQAE
jgi:ATP-binding cassette subfamily F protein 3